MCVLGKPVDPEYYRELAAKLDKIGDVLEIATHNSPQIAADLHMFAREMRVSLSSRFLMQDQELAVAAVRVQREQVSPSRIKARN